jgi:hypothetical protein
MVNVIAEHLIAVPGIKSNYHVKNFGNLYAGKSSVWFYRKWSAGYKKFNDAARDAFNKGLTFSASFDLTACYDSIDHNVLRHFLKEIKCDDEFIDTLVSCLSKWTGNQSSQIYHNHGIPQGPLASGLLSEVVLKYFDIKYGNPPQMRYMRYVDDIRLFASSEKELRLMLIQFDRLSKDIGLFPQSSKIEIHEVKNIEEELKSVSNPTESAIKWKIVNQDKLQRRIIALTKGYKIENQTRFKYLLAHAVPSSKINNRVWRLFKDNPSNFETTLKYFQKYEFLPDSVVNLIIKEIETKPAYSAITAALFETLNGRIRPAQVPRVTRRCRPTEKSGNNCDLKTTNGEIEMVRKLSDYVDGIEYFPIDGKIDGDGNFTLLLPMNLQRMVTDETGVLVLSQNPNEGIPTQSKVRFRFNFSNFNYKFFGGTSRAGSYLVPNMYNRFQFGADTHEDDLFEIKWKKIYTVSQYIPKYSKNNGASALFFTGIKNIEDCDNNYSFPFNRVFTYLDPLYVFIATILGIFYVIVKAINAIPGVEIKLSCDDEELELDEWYDCIRQNLAESLGVIRYQFFNDWVNGSLYAPMFAYKVKMKNGQKKWEKYCDFDCREKVNTPPNAVNYKNKCRNAFITENNEFIDVNNPVKEINRGFVLNYDEHYYYAARSDVEKNPTVSNDLFPSEKKHLLFATNLMELGSSVKCDVDSIPYLIKLLVPTSYNENEEGDILVNIEGLKPNKFNRNGIMLISQVETEQYSDFYGYKLTGNFQNSWFLLF